MLDYSTYAPQKTMLEGRTNSPNGACSHLLVSSTLNSLRIDRHIGVNLRLTRRIIMLSFSCEFDRHIGVNLRVTRRIIMLSSSCEFDRHIGVNLRLTRRIIMLSSSCEFDRHIGVRVAYARSSAPSSTRLECTLFNTAGMHPLQHGWNARSSTRMVSVACTLFINGHHHAINESC
jgi:hypothetical protein